MAYIDRAMVDLLTRLSTSQLQTNDAGEPLVVPADPLTKGQKARLRTEQVTAAGAAGPLLMRPLGALASFIDRAAKEQAKRVAAASAQNTVYSYEPPAPPPTYNTGITGGGN